MHMMALPFQSSNGAEATGKAAAPTNHPRSHACMLCLPCPALPPHLDEIVCPVGGSVAGGGRAGLAFLGKGREAKVAVQPVWLCGVSEVRHCRVAGGECVALGWRAGRRAFWHGFAIFVAWHGLPDSSGSGAADTDKRNAAHPAHTPHPHLSCCHPRWCKTCFRACHPR